jgi:hypothetical protein
LGNAVKDFSRQDWGFGELGNLRKEPDSTLDQQNTLLSEGNLAHGFLIACPQEAGEAVPSASENARDQSPTPPSLA